MSKNARDVIDEYLESQIDGLSTPTRQWMAGSIVERLTAANLLIVPRSVVEEAERGIGYFGERGIPKNYYLTLAARLRACLPAAPAAADKQGAG